MRGADFVYEVKFERGKLNKIADVPGIKVGHSTFVSEDPRIVTGVTVILPHEGCVYDERLFASYFVLNGYGKSTGFIQVEETGLLETPVVLTGTMNVGRMWDCTAGYVVSKTSAKSVNPVILECNDTRMGKSERRVLRCEHFNEALRNAKEDFELGCVGAGAGMVTFGYKSGIGSSSRIVGNYTVGALAMPNFGSKEDFGSIIILVATNAPLVPYQLRRLSVRASLAIPKIGGKVRHRSGDIVFSFSTAHKLPRDGSVNLRYIVDDSKLFQDLLEAVIEASYEAVVDSLVNGCDVVGRDGKKYRKIPLEELSEKLKRHSL